MSLLSMEEVKQGLDKEFLPLEPMLTGLRLIEGGVTETALDAFERDMNLLLPRAFRDVIRMHDFGRLTIGPVAFCNTGDYLGELVKLNTKVTWWGTGMRPSSLLMVANSDPFAILLDLESGSVLAMDVERGWQFAERVASSFDLFVRGVGSTMLHRNQSADRVALGRDVMSDAGGGYLPYWLQLAK
ncbi:SMI1/KNR4 family protein [Ralstonia pseudosolanacearum]|uniref:SMI1/KNR4 family protein n=1 Tax=Ralstonia pseudosolanacearum TaxID=1310165 RepID=UPI003CE69AB7